MFYLLEMLIKQRFPDVKTIKISQFAQWLHEKTSPPPLIIDARSQAEYAVSHIKSALHIEPNMVQLSEISLNNPILVYCSIGYRSAELAQKLQQKGFENVFNLSGGIFQWVNQENPIFQNTHQVEIVHPYNLIWGKLLKSKYHACIRD